MTIESEPSTEGWKDAKLGELCRVIMGQSPPSSTYNSTGEGMSFLQGKADFGDINPMPKTFCTQPLRLAVKGSVLISVRAPVGDVNLADRNYIIGRGLAALELLEGDNEFLFYLLKRYQDRIESLGSGTTFQSINKETLNRFTVRIPPIAQQRAITHVLQTSQRAKATRQRELALERERKTTLMHYLFTHGTRGEIPKDCLVLSLREVAKIERGKFSHRPRNAPEFYGGTTPFIQTGDVTASNGHITRHSQTLNEKGLSVSRVFPRGTIVITIAANIGFTAILDFDSAFPDSLIGITPNEDIDAEFLNYYLTTQQPEMDRKAPRGTQKNINIEFLNPWPVLVPPLDEQRAIAQLLSCCDKKIENLRQEIALLSELFDAMLDELMTGNLSCAAIKLMGPNL